MFGIGLGSLVRIGFRVSDHILKQQEIERSRTASERARLQAEASREKAIEENARHRRTMLEDEIARASVAVECPNCGSTGNRIRKGSTGFCQFCGTAIQISQSGIAYIADPIEKAKALATEDIKKKVADNVDVNVLLKELERAEEHLLGFDVVVDCAVIVEMVACKIGEDAAGKFKSIYTVLHTGVRTYLHECILTTGFNHIVQ